MSTDSAPLPRLTGLDDALRSMGSRLLESHPSLESGLLTLRDRYARAYIWLTATTNRLRYDAPPAPYRFLEVDPASIEYVAELPGPMFRHAGVVTDGDWDQTTTRFEDLDVYRAYERHFEHDVPWSETAFYDRIVDEIADGNVRWDCPTPAAFDARCDRIDDLYERIQETGYRTQADLLDSSLEDPIKSQHRLRTERLKDEISIHIGRDGELLFEDGRNRLSIAKLLDLDRIPVRVLRRHAAWQDVREAFVAGDPAVSEYASHPDIRHFADGDNS